MASAIPRPFLQAMAASAPPPSQEMLSRINSARLAALVENLSSHFNTAARSPDDLLKMCFSLARGIDFALSNNDIPAIAGRLPSLLKQVYQHKNDNSMKPAITMLMISVKNACRNGWFHVTDSAELLKMADELCNSFCMATSIVTTEMRNALDTISNIFPRFYPQLKLCHLVVSFEAKPGYSVLMSDFLIQKYITPEEKIRLFVAQTDNLETSSCLVSPPQVSFLVNGKGIERRTNVFMDSGPQFPTDITKLLKYGMNIIQAFGTFSGNYIIAIAFMSKITSASPPVLSDYVPPIATELNSDPELIEGPSRISLKCPISFMRIRTPVKGHLCKHHQCFDYDNYMEMNSRKPSWRCPCCNQPTSFIDLRIDQNMVKVLGEVRDDIGDVIVFADGSWKEFVESDGSRQLNNGALTSQQYGGTGCERNEISSPLANVLDLTMDDYGESDVLLTSRQVEPLHGSDKIDSNKCETEDTKPFRSSQGFSLSQSFQEQVPVIHVTGLTQGASNQTTDYTCPRNWSTANASNGTLESLIPNNVLNPVITDANSIIGAVSERQQIPREVSRVPVPIAVQTLPAHIQASSSVPRTAPWAHTGLLNSGSIIHSCSPPSQTITLTAGFSDGSSAVCGDINAQQHSWPSDTVSTLRQLQTIAQNLDQSRHSSLNLPFQQNGIPASCQSITIVPPGQQRAGAYGATLQIPSDHPNLHFRLPRREPIASQCPNTLPQLSCTPALQVQQASHIGMAAGNLTAMAGQYDQLLTSHAAMVARLQSLNPCRSRTRSSYPVLTDDLGLMGSEQLQNIVVGPTVASRAEGFPELPSEHQWQPTGRMRGSLTGSAYSAALNRYLVQRSQQVSSVTRHSAFATSSQLLGYSSNNINDQGSTVQQASWRHSN